jgi:hypothetical protein
MKRISILVIGIVALASVLLVYARTQKSRSVSQLIQQPVPKGQRDADERTVATQTRINRHFHSDVTAKLLEQAARPGNDRGSNTLTGKRETLGCPTNWLAAAQPYRKIKSRLP